MSGLMAKKEMNLSLIPPDLEKDFVKQVMSAYFDSHWLDLHHISFLVEDFCVYAKSFEETGDSFLLADDPKMTDEQYAEIKENHFNELMSDVYEVMKYHNMFHAWNDIGDVETYRLISVAYAPVKAVW